VAAGGELWYHGDFDWPGVAIAADVIERHGGRAWRMNAGDYLAGAGADGSYLALSGDPVATPWDPELRETMRVTGRAVYEETVADQLLADLVGYKPARAAGCTGLPVAHLGRTITSEDVRRLEDDDQ
jgi:uncharacterized protein (TIGR02679 family)